MSRASTAGADLDELAELPELDVDDGEEEGDESGGIDLTLPEPDGDPDDEGLTDVLPIELGLSDPRGEPSALGDDATGVGDAPATLGLSLEERSESLLGSDRELGAEQDTTLGIHELPDTQDETDADGLDDPDGLAVDADALPPLEGDDEGDEEVDVGIDISEPPVEPPDDELGAGQA